MTFRTRRAVSMAAAALLASGAFTALGAPAHAAGTETDLAVTAAGTRVAAGVEGKVGWAKIANQGEGTPGKVLFKVDTSKVDATKLVLEAYTGEGDLCRPTGDPKPGLFTCELTAIPGPGETTEVPLVLFKATEQVTGPYSAPVTISIESADDTDDSNNSVDVDVELTAESGVDLGVIVPDVKTRIDLDTFEEEGPLRPGDFGILWSEVINQGDRIAKGVKLTYQLPKGATFLPIDGCDLSANQRTLVCEDKSFPFEPNTILFLPLAIEVSEKVEAPVTLKDGSLAATAFGELPAEARVSKQKKAKPAFAKAEVRSAEESEFADLDPSDNSDDFAVVVAASEGGGGGGGGLPVTGVQAGLIGAVGAGVVLAGAAMFLVARRRRVVMVTPGDEKTTD
ncbi:LPXTG cell wall anchor domain-containing protein [Micromonospora sp. FIMYZ51]|uniref:LPXTG cell wall anchor domain-containing protein n=1 Tax=Micromonospora sp. FIMYZ51 TaxID=3051832 RepID=UPI00311F3D7A